MLAAIRIKGQVNVKKVVESTLKMLNLHKKNNCTLVEERPEIKGMLTKAKDHITWGEINEETKKMLIEKRGEKGKKTFRLNPPRGGFERKGIKKSYKKGGALGYRGEAINELIKKMI